MKYRRRDLLRTAVGLAPGLLFTPIRQSRASALGRYVVVVHLRGGADGLGLVFPTRDPDYFEARPTLANYSGLLLTDRFAMHAGLSELHSFFSRGDLAVFHGVGVENATRAHQRSQARLADSLWATENAPPKWLDPTGETTLDAQLERAAERIASDAGSGVLVVTQSGWDTHRDQAGQLERLTRDLSGGLADFKHRLGANWPRVRCLIVSEFGRTARENRYGGTDHGSGAVALLLGRGINERRVVDAQGRWPGLSRSALCDGRDLPVLTDLRALFREAAHSSREDLWG